MSGPSAATRRARGLQVVATGRPASFALTAPAYAFAIVGWVSAMSVLAGSADELSSGAIYEQGPVLVAHLVGLVVFPFAVVAAVWQLLPMMLRNEPPTQRARPLALVLLAAGIPLAVSVAVGSDRLAAVCAALLALGLVLLVVEVASLIRGVPPGRLLVVSRVAVALALANAVIAFGLGGIAFADDNSKPLGIPYERFLLIHLSFALVGWLTVLIAAVGRTLVPMLGLARTANRRSFPVAESCIVSGLWLYAVGLASGVGAAAASGIVIMAAGLLPVAILFLRVAGQGKIGVREGPVAHVAVGLVLAAQAAVLGIAGSLDWIDARRAAIAAVVLFGLGWAAGVIIGHLGKLVSLSGWGSWPPGPRPKQEALYPRRVWQLEVVAFGVGVELVAAGVLRETRVLILAGGLTLVGAGLLAAFGVGLTLQRVAVGRRHS